MSRLPVPGGDDNIWGEVLNDYLNVSHNPDGTFKPEMLPSTVVDGSITPAKLSTSYIPASQKAAASGVATLDGSGQIPVSQIPSGIVQADATTASKGILQLSGDLSGTAASPTVPGLAGKYTRPVSGIPESDLSVEIQTKLNKGASIAGATTTSKGTVRLSGDLGGTAASPAVPGLSGRIPSSQKAAAFGVATLDGGAKVPVSQLPGTFSPDASSTTKGILRLTNHLSGTADNPTIPGLSSKAIEGDVMHLMGPETVTGKKTFTHPIEVPKPTNPPDTVHKKYVDDLLATATTPDATITEKGLVRIAGDLGGTAASPVVMGKINITEKASASGVATLDGSAKVPTTQLPAFGKIQPFYSSGLLMVEPGTHRLYNDTASAWRIISVRSSVGTAPSGSAVVVDINIDGTTIFTTQANRPSITSGSNASSKVTNMNITTVNPGSYLTVDIDAVGSTTPGSDLTVQVELS